MSRFAGEAFRCLERPAAVAGPVLLPSVDAAAPRPPTETASCAPIDLWCGRYPDEALIGAERKAREREARGKQLRYGLSLQRRHTPPARRLLAEG